MTSSARRRCWWPHIRICPGQSPHCFQSAGLLWEEGTRPVLSGEAPGKGGGQDGCPRALSSLSLGWAGPERQMRELSQPRSLCWTGASLPAAPPPQAWPHCMPCKSSILNQDLICDCQVERRGWEKCVPTEACSRNHPGMLPRSGVEGRLAGIPNAQQRPWRRRGHHR